jgi:hypothetical protein
MALYDSPVNRSYVVLTHTARPLFQKNGFNQVGNEAVPANQISASRVTPSAIYNKNLAGVKGISEAGYGQRYPFRGLSYPGAGSPAVSLYRPGLSYGGAGSPRTSLTGLRYPGAGSPRTSVYRPGLSYGGAGSPRGSILRDAYINDNPPAGTLRPLRGLRDDTSTPVDTGVASGPTIPGQSITTDPAQPASSSGGFFSAISNAFGSVFSTAVASGTSAADLSVANAITGAASTSPTAPKPITVLGTSVTSKSFLGLSTTTLLLIGAGVYFYMKK